MRNTKLMHCRGDLRSPFFKDTYGESFKSYQSIKQGDRQVAPTRVSARRCCANGQRGVTLVELIISMVIISIALGGILLVINYTTSHSADPVIQHQALAIAEAYLEEIELQNYADPDGSDVGETRATFDDVDDYDKDSTHGINGQSPPENQNGATIDALSGYTVTVTMTTTTLNGVTAKKITVTVHHDAMGDLILTGYRTQYN